MFEALAKFIKVAKQDATLRKMEQVGSNHPMYKQQIKDNPFNAPQSNARRELVEGKSEPQPANPFNQQKTVLKGTTKPLPVNYRQAIHEESKDVKMGEQLQNIVKRAWAGGVQQTESITDTFTNIQHATAGLTKRLVNEKPEIANTIGKAFGTKTVDNEQDRKAFNQGVDQEMERLYEKALDDPYVNDQWEQYYEWREGKKMSGTSEFVGDALASSLAMIPQMAISAVAGPVAGFTYMGGRVFNQSYNQAIGEGASVEQASTYGALSSTLEIVLETMVGGIPFLNKTGWLEDGLKAISKQPVAQGFIKKAVDIFGEGVEEYLAEVIGSALEKVYKKTDKSIIETMAESAVSKDAFLSALAGMISAGTMQLGHYATAVSAKGIVQSNIRRIANEPIEQQYAYIQNFASRNDLQVEIKDLGNNQQNAMWVDGKIVINSQAKTPVLALLAHEVAHDMEFVTTLKDGQQTRVYSKAYKEAQQALFSMFPQPEINRMVNERLQIYQNYYNELAKQNGEAPRRATVDEARRELFAKLLEEHFTTNLDSIRRLIKQHPTVADRIHMALQEYSVSASEVETGNLRNARHIEHIYAELIEGHRIEQQAINQEFGLYDRFDNSTLVSAPEISAVADLMPTQASLQAINDSLTQREYGTLNPEPVQKDAVERALDDFSAELLRRGINVQFSLDEVDRKQMRNLDNKEYKLVGVHVTTADKLAENIALGGLVYPSVAVNFVKNPIETFTKHAVFVLRSDAILPNRNDVMMYNKDFVSPTRKPVERIANREEVENQIRIVRDALSKYNGSDVVINQNVEAFKAFISDIVDGNYLNEAQRVYTWASRTELRRLSARINGTDSIEVASRWLKGIADKIIAEKIQVVYQNGKIIKRLPYNADSVLDALENTRLMGDEFMTDKLNSFQVLTAMNSVKIDTYDDLIRAMQYLVSNPVYKDKVDRMERMLYTFTQNMYNNFSNKNIPFNQFLVQLRDGLVMFLKNNEPSDNNLRRYLVRDMRLNNVIHQKQNQSVIVELQAIVAEMFSAVSQYHEAKRIGLVPFRDVRAVIIRRDRLMGLKYSKTDTTYASVDIDALANKMAVDLKRAGVQTVYLAKTDADEMNMLKDMDDIDIRQHLFKESKTLYSLDETKNILTFDPTKYAGFNLTTWTVAEKSLPNRLTVEQAIRFMKNNAKADESEWMSVVDELNKKNPKEYISRQEVLDLILNDPFKLTIKDIDPPYFRGYAFGVDNYKERALIVESPKLPAPDSIDAFQHKLHFIEPNVIAHARYTDVYSADGKKNLMLEEIQSDWHQDGATDDKRYNYQQAQEIEARLKDYQSKANYQPVIERATEAFKRAYTGSVFVVDTPRNGILMVETTNLEDVFKKVAKDLYDSTYVSHKKSPSGFGPRNYELVMRDNGNTVTRVVVLDTIRPSQDIEALITKAVTGQLQSDIDFLKAIDNGNVYSAISQELNQINTNHQLAHQTERELYNFKNGKVPDVPWTNSWVEMTVRSALMEAIDQNYDRIVVPTGYETVRRYDPSIRRVDTYDIVFSKTNDGVMVEISSGNQVGTVEMVDDMDTFTAESFAEKYKRSDTGLKQSKIPLTPDDLTEIVEEYKNFKNNRRSVHQTHLEYHGLLYRAQMVGYSGKAYLYESRIPSELKKLGKKFGVAPERGVFSAHKDRPTSQTQIAPRLLEISAEIANLDTMVDETDPYMNQNDIRSKFSIFVQQFKNATDRILHNIDRFTPFTAFKEMHMVAYNHQTAYMGVGQNSNANNARLVGMMLSYAYEIKNLVATYQAISKPLSYENKSDNPIENQIMFDEQLDSTRVGNFIYMDITPEMKQAYKGNLPLFSINEFDSKHNGMHSLLYKNIYEKMRPTDTVRNIIKLATTNIKAQEYEWLGLKQWLESKDLNERLSKEEVLAVMHNNNIELDISKSDSYTDSDYTYGENGLNHLLTINHPSITEAYDGGHWAEENVVLHYRTSNVTDADGNAVLLMNELQSDWYQHGKRQGYQGSETQLTGQQISKEFTEHLKDKLRPIKLELRRIAREKGYVRKIAMSPPPNTFAILHPAHINRVFGDHFFSKFETVGEALDYIKTAFQKNYQDTAIMASQKVANSIDWKTLNYTKEVITDYGVSVTIYTVFADKTTRERRTLIRYIENRLPFTEDTKTAVDDFIDRLREIETTFDVSGALSSYWQKPQYIEMVDNAQLTLFGNLILDVGLEIPDFMTTLEAQREWRDDFSQYRDRAVRANDSYVGNKVPNAPYKDDLWVDLGVRSFLKTAVDKGFDKVYFANGMMNTARYMDEENEMPDGSDYNQADHVKITAELSYEEASVSFIVELGEDYENDEVVRFDVPMRDNDFNGILDMNSWVEAKNVLFNYIQDEDYALYTIMTRTNNTESIDNAFRVFYEETIKPLVALTKKNIKKYEKAVDEGDDEENSVWTSISDMLTVSKSYYSPLEPNKAEIPENTKIDFNEIERYKGMNLYYDIKIPKAINKLLNKYGVSVIPERGFGQDFGITMDDVRNTFRLNNIMVDVDNRIQLNKIIRETVSNFSEDPEGEINVTKAVIKDELIEQGIIDLMQRKYYLDEELGIDNALDVLVNDIYRIAMQAEDQRHHYADLLSYENPADPDKSDDYLNYTAKEVQAFHSVTLTEEAVNFIKKDMPLFLLDEEMQFTGMMYALNEKDMSALLNTEHALHQGFYSAMRKVIAEKMGNSAFVRDVVKIAQTGTKAEEYEWSGLKEWLESKDPNEKVTQQEVLNKLTADAFKITEHNSTNWIDYSLGSQDRLNYVYNLNDPKVNRQMFNKVRSHWESIAPQAISHYRKSVGFGKDLDDTIVQSYIVEEIQSDWHQRGAKDGYINEAEIMPLQKELGDLTKRESEIKKEAKKMIDGIDFKDEKRWNPKYKKIHLHGNTTWAFHSNITTPIGATDSITDIDIPMVYKPEPNKPWSKYFARGPWVEGTTFKEMVESFEIPSTITERGDRQNYFDSYQKTLRDNAMVKTNYEPLEMEIYDYDYYDSDDAPSVMLDILYGKFSQRKRIRVFENYPWASPLSLFFHPDKFDVIKLTKRDNYGSQIWYMFRKTDSDQYSDDDMDIMNRHPRHLFNIAESKLRDAKNILQMTDWLGHGLDEVTARDNIPYDYTYRSDLVFSPMFDELVAEMKEHTKRHYLMEPDEFLLTETEIDTIIDMAVDHLRTELNMNRKQEQLAKVTQDKAPQGPLKKTWLDFTVNNAIRNAILDGHKRIYFANGEINTHRWGEYGFMEPRSIQFAPLLTNTNEISVNIEFNLAKYMPYQIEKDNIERNLRVIVQPDGPFLWVANGMRYTKEDYFAKTPAKDREPFLNKDFLAETERLLTEFIAQQTPETIKNRKMYLLGEDTKKRLTAPYQKRQRGMEQFYDVQLPSLLKKIAKKYNTDVKAGLVFGSTNDANRYDFHVSINKTFEPRTFIRTAVIKDIFDEHYRLMKLFQDDMPAPMSTSNQGFDKQSFTQINDAYRKYYDDKDETMRNYLGKLYNNAMISEPKIEFDWVFAISSQLKSTIVGKDDDYYNKPIDENGKVLVHPNDYSRMENYIRRLSVEGIDEILRYMEKVNDHYIKYRAMLDDPLFERLDPMIQMMFEEKDVAGELFTHIYDNQHELRAVNQMLRETALKFEDARKDLKTFLDGRSQNKPEFEAIMQKIKNGTATEDDMFMLKSDKSFANYFNYIEVNDDMKKAYTEGWGMPLYSLSRDYEAEFLRQRAHQQTIIDSGHMTDDIVDEVAKDIAKGRFTYITSSNKNILKHAQDLIEYNGFDHMFNMLGMKIKTGERITKDDIAIAEALIKQGVMEKRTTQVLQLIADLALMGTELGQAVQALSLIRKMTPEGQLMTLQRTVGRMNSIYARQGRDIDIAINPDIAERLFPEDGHTPSQQEIAQVMEDIKVDIAEQLPVTWLDKLNAWRYLSMLGNLLTHLRNIMGNAIFLPVRVMKDLVGLGIESGSIGLKWMTPEERTKAILPWHHHSKKGISVVGDQNSADAERLRFAYRDFLDMKNIIQGSAGKFDIQRDIAFKRTIFKSENKLLKKPMQWLEAVREFNFEMLEAEDLWFMERHYVNSLAMYMKAQNIHGDTITPEQLQQAQNYAIEEARKMTYRDFSNVANLLTHLEQRGGKFTRFAMQSTVPFKKTPINIMKRGVEYSPIGLASAITKDVYKLHNGDIDAHQFIENLSAGLTGTGIAIMGMLLYSLGWLNMGRDDDERKLGSFESMQGEQKYSIELPNNMGTYTIDWAVPTVLPFIVGGELARAFDKETDKNLTNAIPEAFLNIMDPVFELTMLRGVTDTIQSFSGSGSAMVGESITTMIASYIGQLFPTMGGQIARAIDPYMKNTYAPKDSPFNKTLESIGRKVLNKIPFGTYLNEPSIDLRGDPVERTGDNFVERVMMNMLSVGYYKPKESTKVDNAIAELYDKTKDTSVIPRNYPASNSFTYEDKDYILSGKELTEFKKAMGKNQYRFVEEIMRSPEYRSASDEDKVKLINNVYDHAYAIAKNKALQGRKVRFEDSAYQKVVGGAQVGLSVADYYRARYVYNTTDEISEITPANPFKKKEAGKKVFATKKSQIIEKYRKMGYTQEQIEYLMVAIGGYKIDDDTKDAIGGSTINPFKRK